MHEPTAAEQVVARLDSYSQEEHAQHIEAARERIEGRRAARRDRAAEAAWRLANWPTPEWGWDALPEEERGEWRKR